MIVVTVGQETVGDAARFDMQPRHLLHASAAAVEKDPRRPNVHQDRRATAQRVRIGCAGSEKANFHDNSLLARTESGKKLLLLPGLHVLRLQTTQYGAEQSDVYRRALPVRDNLIRIG